METMMPAKLTQPKPPVFTHAKFVLVRRPDKSVDVCDPTTRTWATFKTERLAKWSATIYSNLSERFGHQLADDAAIEATLANTSPSIHPTI